MPNSKRFEDRAKYYSGLTAEIADPDFSNDAKQALRLRLDAGTSMNQAVAFTRRGGKRLKMPYFERQTSEEERLTGMLTH
jgi:hypothetical protein